MTTITRNRRPTGPALLHHGFRPFFLGARAHLKRRGFGDVEVNVTGGYDPNETAETSRLVQAELAVYARRRGGDAEPAGPVS